MGMTSPTDRLSSLFLTSLHSFYNYNLFQDTVLLKQLYLFFLNSLQGGILLNFLSFPYVDMLLKSSGVEPQTLSCLEAFRTESFYA